MGRILRYIYFLISRWIESRRGDRELARMHTTIFMSAIDGFYIGALLVTVATLLEIPYAPEFGDRWRYPLGVVFAVIVLTIHYRVFATKRRDRQILEEFSEMPFARGLKSLILVAWFMGGPSLMAAAITFRRVHLLGPGAPLF